MNTGAVLSIPATVMRSHRSERLPPESGMLSCRAVWSCTERSSGLDEHGHCQFRELLFRRGEPRFIAFDLLQGSGKDLRRERLQDRKHELRRVIGNDLPPIAHLRSGICNSKRNLGMRQVIDLS